MWLKKLQMKFRKRTFTNAVLIQCNHLIHEFLENDDSSTREKLQETVGKHYFDVIRKKGSQETKDFKEEMIKKVIGIIESDNPIVSMRRDLIRLIHTNVQNCTYFIEKFSDRREELFEALNKNYGEIVTSDEIASTLWIYSGAESCILRLLQFEFFEEVGKDDWFERYSKAYSIYIEMLYEVGLKLKDEKDCLLDGVTFPVVKSLVEQFQEKLIGEVIG